MDGLRKFIEVDNHEAVKVGGLHRETKSIRVVRLKFTTDFPGAVIREGTDELTLRVEEQGARRTFIDTTNVGPAMESSAGRCGLACILPGQLPGN